MFEEQPRAKPPFQFSAASGAARCAACRFFTGDPAALERALAGFNILSSAYGSVRADTGLCDRHDVFTTAASPACAQFETASQARDNER